MKKEDMRVMLTKKLLQQALATLLGEKHYTDITIKELTEKAGVNRGSFYQHYNNIEELIDDMNNSIIKECFGYAFSGKCVDTMEFQKEVIHNAFEFFARNRTVLKVMYSQFGAYSLNAKLRSTLIPMLYKRYRELIPTSVSDSEVKALVIYTYGGASQLLDDWLNNETKMSLAELEKVTSDFSKANIAKYLEKK